MSNTIIPRPHDLATWLSIVLPLVAISLVCAGTPVRAETPTTVCRPAAAEAQPRDCLRGRWKLIAIATAPWARTAPDRRSLHGKEITFEKGAMRSDVLFACENARQTVIQMERAGLFEGNLPNEGKDSNLEAELGLDKAGRGTPTVRVHCENGSYDFHLASEDVFIFAYINVLYRAVKVGP